MTIHGTHQTKFFIGPEHIGDADNADLTFFEAVTDWVEIGSIDDLGEMGPEANIARAAHIGSDYVQRRNIGPIDNGTIEMSGARDPADAGQNRARAAVGRDNRLFKVILNDKPSLDGTPTTWYFVAAVGAGRSRFGTSTDDTKFAITLGISGAIIEVLASVNVTLTPASGALTAATDETPYTASVVASGGSGIVTYAVTEGTLPAGLTLNPATGAITGTPTTPGTSNFTITATYTGSGHKSAAYSIVVGA